MKTSIPSLEIPGKQLILVALAICLSMAGCTNRQEPPPQGYSKSAPSRDRSTVIPAQCTADWRRLVDQRLAISDASGHGPDIGSAEWMNAVGRKSGVVDAEGHGPDPGSEEWCRAVDYKVFGRR
jgi:hypothetical protein